MAKRRRRRTTTRRRKRSRGRRRRRNATAIIANPRRRRRSTTRRRPKRRSGRRRRRSNPTITFTDALITFGKGLAGGALAGGIDWGVSYAPVGETAQAAMSGGGGLVVSIALAKWVDPAVGAGCAGGTVLALMNRIRRMLALKDLGKAAEKKNGDEKTNGQASGVFRAKRVSDSGKVIETTREQVKDRPRTFRSGRDSAGMTPFPGAQTLPVTALPARSIKGNQQVDAGSSMYVANGNRFGPLSHNWARQIIDASAHRHRDESGRVIRVVGAYN